MPFSPLIGGLLIILTSIGLWGRFIHSLLQRPLILGFVGLAAWWVVTASFAIDLEAAFLGLYNFLPGAIVFAGLSCIFQTTRQLKQLAWLLVLAAMPVVLIGSGQLFWGWAGHPNILGIVLDLPVDRGGNPPGRMASIFQYANFLAAYLLMVFPLGLGLWFDAWETAKASSKQSLLSPPLLRLTLLSFALISIAAAMLLTSSRNAWFLGTISLTVFALYRGWSWVVGAIGVGMTCIVGATVSPNPLQSWLRSWVPAFLWIRLSDEMFQNRPVAEFRTTQWQFAWSMVEQRPWVGWGLRSFTPLYEAAQHQWLGHPHNLFLMMAAETGLPSAFLLFGLVGFVLFRGVLYLQFLSCPEEDSGKSLGALNQSKLIFLAYFVSFGACTLFNVLDVTVFDVRLNILGWGTLAAMNGVMYHQGKFNSSNLKSNPAFKF